MKAQTMDMHTQAVLRTAEKILRPFMATATRPEPHRLARDELHEARQYAGGNEANRGHIEINAKDLHWARVTQLHTTRTLAKLICPWHG